MRRISETERIENYFRTAPLPECKIQQDRIALIMRIRDPEQWPTKLGRPRKKTIVAPIENAAKETA